MKILAWILFLISVLYSCEKAFWDYHITIENDYFEPVTAIQIISRDTIWIDTLTVGQISEEIILPEGNYELKVMTLSNLFLNTDVYLTGKEEFIRLVIQKDGKIRND